MGLTGFDVAKLVSWTAGERTPKNAKLAANDSTFETAAAA